MLMSRFYALSFRMPSDDALVSFVLLLTVLVVCGVILLKTVIKENAVAAQVFYLVCGLVAVVVILRTFTTWGG